MGQRITIATLNAMVTANAVQFVNEMNRVANYAGNIGRKINDALSAVGIGLSVAGAVAFTKSIIDLGSHIVDLAREAGMTNQVFQTMSAIAMESGVSMEQIAKASENFRKKIQEAREGSAELQKGLRALNLTAAGLQALKPEEQWEVFAKRIHEAKDQQEAMNVASMFFGEKVGPKMKEVLDRLAKDGFDKLAETTSKIRLTDEQLKSLDDAGDALERIALQMKVIGAQLLLSGQKRTWKDNLLSALTFGGSDVFNIGKTISNNFSDKPTPTTDRVPTGRTGTNSSGNDKPVEVRMAEGEKNRDLFEKLKEEKNQRAEVKDMLDLFFHDMDEHERNRRPPIEKANFPELNTDRLSRVGLLTGEGEQLKQQTNYLRKIADQVLDLNRNFLRMTAAFTPTYS